jgi:hypothetical protein
MHIARRSRTYRKLLRIGPFSSPFVARCRCESPGRGSATRILTTGDHSTERPHRPTLQKYDVAGAAPAAGMGWHLCRRCSADQGEPNAGKAAFGHADRASEELAHVVTTPVTL